MVHHTSKLKTRIVNMNKYKKVSRLSTIGGWIQVFSIFLLPIFVVACSTPGPTPVALQSQELQETEREMSKRLSVVQIHTQVDYLRRELVQIDREIERNRDQLAKAPDLGLEAEERGELKSDRDYLMLRRSVLFERLTYKINELEDAKMFALAESEDIDQSE